MSTSLRKLYYLLVFLAALPACGISNIPTFDQAVNSAWQEVHNQYSRRSDLVQQLLDRLQQQPLVGEVLFERLNIAEARVIQMNVSPQTLTDTAEFSLFRDNQLALSEALDSMMESIKDSDWFIADEQLQSLQEELQKSATLISAARRDYSQKVNRYNKELETVPGRWWRAFMYSDSLQKEDFPELPEQARLIPLN